MLRVSPATPRVSPTARVPSGREGSHVLCVSRMRRSRPAPPVRGASTRSAGRWHMRSARHGVEGGGVGGGEEDVEEVENDANVVTSTGLTEEEVEEGRKFAAATGLFSLAAFGVSSGERGPACLLDADPEADLDNESPKDRKRQGSTLGNGMLALALGVAGFGTVGGGHGGRPFHMEQAAHAATTSRTTTTTWRASSSSSSSKETVGRPSRRSFSPSLLPTAYTPSGSVRAHPDHIGPVPNPHLEDMICSRWFVGSMNAIG